MLITPWLKLFVNRLRWVARFGGRRRRSTETRFLRRNLVSSRSAPQFSFERLEDRTLLSTLTVNSLADNQTAGDGNFTLREAIANANSDADTTGGDGLAGSGADEIVFAAGLTGTINLTLGQLEITEDLTITGLGPAHTIIDAQQNSRIFDITNTVGDVTLEGLTLRNGDTSDDGGAVRSQATGQLTVETNLFRGNSTRNAGNHGGAIDAAADVVIRNSTFEQNNVSGTSDGGAVHVSSGTLTIERSTFDRNRTIDHNAYGGAIATSGNVTISDSTLSNNSTNWFDSDGGAIHSSGNVTILRSTLTGNSTQGDDAVGGAIFAGNNLTIINSTLSGNSTSGDAAHGGAIYGQYITIVNSTITGNRANAANAIGGGIHQIGGVASSTHIRNSIVADNYAYTNPDLYSDFNNFVIDNSLVGDASGTTLIETGTAAPDANGNFIGDFNGFGVIDPLLGPLQNNGGFVETHALLAGSLAIDSGDNALAVDPSNGNAALTTDGRGFFFARIFNSTVDMGAYELQTFDPSLFVVDNATDEFDGDLSNGDRSLREVVALANGNPGADTITFAAALNGTPLLLDGATFGDIDIFEDVTITGNGATNTIIDAQQLSRIFSINESVGDATIAGLTLRNGETTGTISNGDGGAILSHATGRLTITASTFSNNSTTGEASAGGAIFSGLGDVVVQDSTFSGNSTSGDTANGGAIGTYADSLTLIRSTFTDNSTTGYASRGGAVSASYDDITITDSIFTGNSTATAFSSGGAVVASGDVVVTGSTFAGNSTTGDHAYGGAIVGGDSVSVTNSTLNGNSTAGDDANGGAIHSGGDLTITDSTLSRNRTEHASSSGGAAEFNGMATITRSTLRNNTTMENGGALYSTDGGVTATASTIHGNRADRFNGGGIWLETGDVDILSSTVSDNSAGSNGGGVYAGDGNVTVINSTISRNRAEDGAGISQEGVSESTTIINSTITDNFATEEYGGIYSEGDLTVYNSIVAGNIDLDGTPDLFSDTGVYNILHSLIGDAAGTTLTETGIGAPDANGNFIGDSTGGGIIDPLLGPLQNNGGFVDTHALLPGSLAIDSGDNLLAVDVTNGNAPLTTDERGGFFARIVNGTVDMGAVEAQTFDPALLVVDNATDEFDGDLSDGDRSLREVISLANAIAGPNTVTFDAALNGVPLLLDLGQLTISETVTITGNGAANTIIDAQQLSRIFLITGNNVDVTLDSVTLQNGRTIGESERGGAIRDDSSFSGSLLTINDSAFLGNSTTGLDADGGAIYGDSAEISGTIFDGNFTTGENARGGAIGGGADEVLRITDSVFTNNFTSGDGAHGGAIERNARIEISASTFTGNRVTGDGARGGAVAMDATDLIINDSALNGNEATGANSHGGAIYNDSADVTITNSTISGNTTSGLGGGLYSSANDTVRIVQSTIVGNFAADAAGLSIGTGDLVIHNSIVAGNQETTWGLVEHPDLSFGGGFDIQNSLIGDNSGHEADLPATGTSTPDANGNFIGDAANPIDPLIGPLQDNGGPTLTHALLPGSLAIDGGDNALAVDPANGNAPLANDQRGAPFVRIFGLAVDMGAFETQPLSIIDHCAQFTGTPGDDVVVVDLETRTITLNGVEFPLTPEITQFKIDGQGGHDTLIIDGAPGAELVRLLPGVAFLDSSTVDLTGFGSSFEEIIYNAQGNGDRAVFIDSPGDDDFTAETIAGVPTFGMEGPGFVNTAAGVESVAAIANRGGNDEANVGDSAGDDTFVGRPTVATMAASTFGLDLFNFERVAAEATTGMDRAVFKDSTANVTDTLVATPTFASLTGPGYTLEANNFDFISAESLGGSDVARVFGSDAAETTRDVFRADPNEAVMTGAGFEFHINSFDQVIARAFGGNDLTLLAGGGGDDLFAANPTFAQMTGVGFDLRAVDFATMIGTAGVGGFDRAFLADSIGNDRFVGFDSTGLLSDIAGTFTQRAHEFDSIRIDGRAGGVNRRLVDNSITYQLIQLGIWV